MINVDSQTSVSESHNNVGMIFTFTVQYELLYTHQARIEDRRK